MPSQRVLFMAWLEPMLETEGQAFVRAVDKWHVKLAADALPTPFVPD